MKITEITVSVGKTINTGNFNSYRAEFALTAELGPDDEPDECQRKLYADIKRKLDAIEAQVLRKN